MAVYFFKDAYISMLWYICIFCVFAMQFIVKCSNKYGIKKKTFKYVNMFLSFKKCEDLLGNWASYYTNHRISQETVTPCSWVRLSFEEFRNLLTWTKEFAIWTSYWFDTLALYWHCSSVSPRKKYTTWLVLSVPS